MLKEFRVNGIKCLLLNELIWVGYIMKKVI